MSDEELGGMGPRERWFHEAYQKLLLKPLADNAAVTLLSTALNAEREKLAVAVEALEKYADPERHSMDKDGFTWSGEYFDYKTAREALAKIKEIK